MEERDPLQLVADRYREEGYDVSIRPVGSELPAFLENSDVDILARKGPHLVALGMNSREATLDSGQASVLVAAELDEDYGKSLLAEAERLLSPDTLRAALLMGWAAFEAAARESLRRKDMEVDKLTPRDLMAALLAQGLITQVDAERLRECFYLRNTVVHGVRPADLTPQIVTFLLGRVRRLLEVGQGEGGLRSGGATSIRIGSSSSASIIRSPLTQAKLKLKCAPKFGQKNGGAYRTCTHALAGCFARHWLSNSAGVR